MSNGITIMYQGPSYTSLRTIPCGALSCMMTLVPIIIYAAYLHDKTYPATDCGHKNKEQCDNVSYRYWYSSGESCDSKSTLATLDILLFVIICIVFIVGVSAMIIWCFTASQERAPMEEVYCSRYEICGYKIGKTGKVRNSYESESSESADIESQLESTSSSVYTYTYDDES